MAKPTPTERRAEAIVTAALYTDREAAEICDVSRRSIVRWRKQMGEDPALAQAVTLKWQEVREADDWVEEATWTIRKAFSFLRRATEALRPSDPEHVEAVTNAIRTLSEAKLAADVIDARLNQTRSADAGHSEQGGRHRAEGRQDVAGYIGRGRG